VAAAKLLVDHALSRFSTDNLSCMIVRFDQQALLESQNNRDKAIGVEGDAAETGTSAVGVSASNSGKGQDAAAAEPDNNADKGFVPTVIEGPVEEEPASIEDSESPEVSSPVERMQVG
jgi:protein phosphatase PTC1